MPKTKTKTYVSTLRTSAKLLASLAQAAKDQDITYSSINELINNALKDYLDILIGTGYCSEITMEDEAWMILEKLNLITKRAKTSNKTIIRKLLQKESLDGDVFANYVDTRRKTKRDLETLEPTSDKVLEVLEKMNKTKGETSDEN